LPGNFQFPIGWLIVSNGTDNLILLIAGAFVNQGEEVVMADPTFAIYSNVTQIMGGRPIKLRLKNLPMIFQPC